jgi:hypothetical protein
MTTHSLMGLVTDLITRLEAGSLKEGFSRPLQRGSARGRVSILADPHDAESLIMVVRLEIMPVPPFRREELYRTLLELNHRLEGRAAFSLEGQDKVFIAAGRPLEDLDPGEVVDLILWTADQADHYDDLLIQRFSTP